MQINVLNIYCSNNTRLIKTKIPSDSLVCKININCCSRLIKTEKIVPQ